MRGMALFLAMLLLLAAAVISRRVGAVQANSAENTVNGVSLPVLMYHSVLRDPARTGEYVITPEALECDLAYLKKNGYTAVSGAMVADFVKNGSPLPEKPVMITFDDGHLNNLTYCAPLMEKYGMKCIVNVVGAFTLQAEKENDPNPYYAYLTRADLDEMEESGLFEIGCHTYNLHSVNGRRGAAMNRGESPEEYAEVLLDDTGKWLNATERKGTMIYAYPYGYYSEDGFETLRQQGFRVLLTCREAGNFITPNGEDIVQLNRYNRSGLVQTDEFMKSAEI